MRRLGVKPSVGLFLAVVTVYSLVAWDRLVQPSPQFHFVDLAESFMAGRLDTDTPRQVASRPQEADPRGYREAIARCKEAGGWNDWAHIRTMTLVDGTVVQGRFPWAADTGDKRHLFHTVDGEERKVVVPGDLARTCGPAGTRLCDETTHYVSFPPFPAVALVPLVAIWGYDTNDVVVTIAVAAAAVVFLFWFLQLLTLRGHSRRTTRDNVWLSVLFAFGTVAFFSSVRGEVWFTALVFGVALNVLYMLAALDARHPLAAGLLLALAVATRVPTAFCFVFFAWQLFLPGGRWEPGRWGQIARQGALFAAPLVAMAAALMAYNQVRFGSPLEFGHAFLSGGAGDRIRDHGLFSTWYLNLNLSAALTNVPMVKLEAPFVQITKHGLGLLFTTPVLLLLCRPAAMPPIRTALWLAILAAALPGLHYQNSGWEQFGYRFALDYMPYLIALLAVGDRPLTRRVKGVVVFAIAVNLFGAITFGRFPFFYS